MRWLCKIEVKQGMNYKIHIFHVNMCHDNTSSNLSKENRDLSHLPIRCNWCNLSGLQTSARFLSLKEVRGFCSTAAAKTLVWAERRGGNLHECRCLCTWIPNKPIVLPYPSMGVKQLPGQRRVRVIVMIRIFQSSGVHFSQPCPINLRHIK